MKEVFFTSSAANYFPKVKLLFESIRKYHPTATLVWLIAEYRRSDVEQIAQKFNFDTIFADDLAVGKDPKWLFGMNIVELSTALKPFAAELILNRYKAQAITYLDPDIVVFRELNDVIGGYGHHDIILTPHLNEPEKTLQLVLDNELCALKHGIFNLGFFGIKDTQNGRAFLKWWQDRVYHFCFTDLASGVFTDQKWINFVPVFFDRVWINKDPTLNVAPWNMAQRTLTGSMREGVKVNGRPLGFYHFTGFDSGAHLKAVAPYIKTNLAIKELVEWYAKESESSVEFNLDRRWRLGHYSNGEKIENAHRVTFREDPELQSKFLNPFDASDQNSFLNWIKSNNSGA